MALLRLLLEKLGLLSPTDQQQYGIDVDTHLELQSLAREQQRNPRALAKELIHQAISRQRSEDHLWQSWQALSPREQDVSALTCLGYTNPQIAYQLGISVETVRTHTRNAQIKLGVASKADLRVLLASWDFSAWHKP